MDYIKNERALAAEKLDNFINKYHSKERSPRTVTNDFSMNDVASKDLDPVFLSISEKENEFEKRDERNM